MWQLPWVPPPVEAPPSEEEIARKAANKEKQGQRLREMAVAKRSSKINELENELRGLEFLLSQLEHFQESDIPSFLAETGYVSRQEVESARSKVVQSLRKQKGEQAEIEKPDVPSNEKYTLINIPDDMLTAEQVSFFFFTVCFIIVRFSSLPSHILNNFFDDYSPCLAKLTMLILFYSFDSLLKRRNSWHSNLCLMGGNDKNRSARKCYRKEQGKKS
jgi:hypothetical protein